MTCLIFELPASKMRENEGPTACRPAVGRMRVRVSPVNAPVGPTVSP